MKFFVSWTYIANFSETPSIVHAKTPKEAYFKFVHLFEDGDGSFFKKARVTVYGDGQFFIYRAGELVNDNKPLQLGL